MARTKEFELEKVKQAAFYYFVENKEEANVLKIAERAGMTRTQLQNHYNIDALRGFAIDNALNILTANIFKIFNKKEVELEVKLKLLVNHFMTQAKRHPNLNTFVRNEFERIDVDVLKILKQKTKEDLQPFIDEFEKQVDEGKFIDIKPLQALIHIMSLSSYPIIADRTIQIATGTSAIYYAMILKQQRDEIVRFILKGLEK